MRNGLTSSCAASPRWRSNRKGWGFGVAVLVVAWPARGGQHPRAGHPSAKSDLVPALYAIAPKGKLDYVLPVRGTLAGTELRLSLAFVRQGQDVLAKLEVWNHSSSEQLVWPLGREYQIEFQSSSGRPASPYLFGNWNPSMLTPDAMVTLPANHYVGSSFLLRGFDARTRGFGLRARAYIGLNYLKQLEPRQLERFTLVSDWVTVPVASSAGTRVRTKP
jgi:hypothetical protein